jgi:hypothetical protein
MELEKELTRKLHDALETDEAFRNWFVAQLHHGRGFSKLTLCRSNNPWGAVRLILPNVQTGALEAVSREGETDVLAVFQDSSGARLGVHIEVKRASGKFTPFQPEGYAARADSWANAEKYGGYQQWETVLIAPKSFIDANAENSRKFTTRIPYETLPISLSASA